MAEPISWNPRGRDEHVARINGHVVVLWRSPESSDGWHGAIDGEAVMDGAARRSWSTRAHAERDLIQLAEA